ncbi:MAG TPA: hypothetical protein VGW10_19185 [Solirubrobacteraceae bacterium]|nr:hypothetical protein [Solirubrobacteraceae bacterium]
MTTRALLLAVIATVVAAAPAAAARDAGVSELEARSAFVLRGIEDADGVAEIGDFDGDGSTDAAVWTDGDDQVRILLGGDRVPGLRSFRIAGARTYDQRPIAGAGDVNGDGLDDLALGLSYSSGVAIVAGTREPRDIDLRRPEQRETVIVGEGVDFASAGGDINGDGVDDLVVAAEGAFDPEEVGVAYVLFGGPGLRGGRKEVTKLEPGAGFRIEGGGDDGPIAVTADALGDVDGDGLGDIALGSPYAGLGDVRSERELLEVSGVVSIVYGRRETTTVDLGRPGPAVTRIESQQSGYLGFALAGAGDVNGDGLADVAMSAPLRPAQGNPDVAARGDAFVVYGARERRPTVDVDALGGAGFRIAGVAGGDVTGFALSPAGDVDADGLADLLVGAPGISDRSPGAIGGAAHVVYGAREPGDVALAAPGDRALALRGAGVDRVGSSLASGTDLDGDGQRELLVSRPGACRIGRLDEGDVVAVEPGSPPVAREGFGSEGDDRLAGGPVGDSLLGFGARDEIAGRDGHDCISGGDGDDRLSGGRSGDAVFGEQGADVVSGDSGCDVIFGGAGDDVIRAGPTRLPLEVRLQAPIGARDRDRVSAGRGDDSVRGGVDSDTLSGGEGNDRLVGGGDSDALEGNPGRDRLEGGPGSDYVVGGHGTDVIIGGSGRDFLGGDVDLGFEFDDVLFGNRPRRIAGDDDIRGGSGDDQMHGEGGRDRLDGGSGRDTAQGMRGDDRLLGGPGDDNLQGGGGGDRISGGGANDQLVGATGDDVLAGGTFGDEIDGGPGADRLFGGSGPDRINARDRDRDVVRCGAGRDRVTTDRRDTVRGCEIVNGRRR